ncbi:TPA: hypothetical protein ACH3X2_001291 [Trebouxia sp. C0005]
MNISHHIIRDCTPNSATPANQIPANPSQIQPGSKESKSLAYSTYSCSATSCWTVAGWPISSLNTDKRARTASLTFRKPHSGEAVSRDTPSLNPDLGQGQGQGQQSIVAGAQAALPDQVKRVMARASIDLTVLEDFQAKALYRKETANSVKLAVSHIGLCPSHEDFERIALKILRR